MFKQQGSGQKAIKNKMEGFLIALVVILSIVHSGALANEEPGVKGDILKRQGTFSPLEQQPVDMSAELEQLRAQLLGKKE